MKLSFCIPTYNHARFLGAALDSILSQISSDFEIVIVDGASTDHTQEVVKAFQARSPVIRYHRVGVNRGIDPDIAESVAMATGDYVWLMSSDDVVPEGTVGQVMAALDTGRSMYLGARRICTEELEVFGTEQALITRSGKTSWDFSKPDDLVDFLGKARGLMAVFSYMSVLIFKRDLWFSVRAGDVGMGTCYAHAYRLWSALTSSGTVEVLSLPVVMCRMGTDNFASRGVFRRFLLDFDGFLGVADTTFGSRPDVREAFLEVLRREHPLFRLVKFYRACGNDAERSIACSRLRAIGHPSITLFLMQSLAALGPLVDLAVIARRIFRRGVGKLTQH